MDAPDELDRVTAQVRALVERMIREGKRGHILVSVHPGSRRAIGKPRPFVFDDADDEAA
jgi:hypothetical protein